MNMLNFTKVPSSWCFGLLVCLCLFSTLSFGVDELGEVNESRLKSVSTEIKEKLDETQASSTGDDSEKENEIQQFEALLAKIERIRNSMGKYAEYKKAELQIPKQLVSIAKEKKAIIKKKEEKPSEKASTEALEKRLNEIKSDIQSLENENTQLTASIEVLIARPPKANQQLLTAKQALNKLEGNSPISVPTTKEETSALQGQDIQEWDLWLERGLLSERVKMLDAEMVTHSQRLQLLEDTRSLNQLKLKRLKKTVKKYQVAFKKRQKEQTLAADQVAEEAKTFVDHESKIVVRLANENIHLSQHLKSLTKILPKYH